MKPMKRLCCLLLALLLPVSAPAEAELPGTGREKEIRILFVGNSLTQDSVTYVPYLLKTCFPFHRKHSQDGRHAVIAFFGYQASRGFSNSSTPTLA